MSATINQTAARQTDARRHGQALRPNVRRSIPLPPLIALGLVAAIGLIGMLPSAPEVSATPVIQGVLTVSTSPDQSIAIRNMATGVVVRRISGNAESFIRGVFHSLDGVRRAHRVDLAEPYRLSQLSDGRVVLQDPSTSTTIDLEGFGTTNASQFMALLGLPPLKASTP